MSIILKNAFRIDFFVKCRMRRICPKKNHCFVLSISKISESSHCTVNFQDFWACSVLLPQESLCIELSYCTILKRFATLSFTVFIKLTFNQGFVPNGLLSKCVFCVVTCLVSARSIMAYNDWGLQFQRCITIEPYILQTAWLTTVSAIMLQTVFADTGTTCSAYSRTDSTYYASLERNACCNTRVSLLNTL